MPLSLLLFVTAFVAVRVTQKVPSRLVVAFGALCIFSGALYMYIMLRGGGEITGAEMIPSMGLLGIGIGCTLSLTGNIALSDIDPKYSNQGSGMITTVNNFGSSMSTSVIGSLFTGGIAGGILRAFITQFPDALGSLTHEQAAIKLEEGFQKMQVMHVSIEDLPTQQVETLREIVIHGVDNAMLPIFTIIMVMALLAAIVAAFFLKPKKKVK